ncbi:MAG: ATP-binding domain-containing protein [Candidatus Acidiferrales bacterium]
MWFASCKKWTPFSRRWPLTHSRTEGKNRCSNRWSNPWSTYAQITCTIHCTKPSQPCPTILISPSQRASILLKIRPPHFASRPEDIIVINPEPTKTRKAVASARSILFSKGINSSLAGVSGSPDIFFESDTVTFTGIFRAKGNEAAMVYVINAQDCFNSYSPANLARIRNQLFTAITRSKAWVRLLGIGSAMDKLINEYHEVAKRDYRLEFKYPDAETRKNLRIISRDISRQRSRRKERDVAELKRIIESIDRGDVDIDDLPTRMRHRLSKLLQGQQ